MSILKWSNNYSIGYSEIDNQHKQLIELLNKSHAGLIAEPVAEDVEVDIMELMDYGLFHLKNEMKWLNRSKGVAVDQYQKGLERLQQRILRVQSHYFKGGKPDSERIVAFMKRWIASHVTAAHETHQDFHRAC